METKQEILQMNREREIDLIALMWEIIYHWRSLIVCAVVCAIGLAGFKYVSDTRAYKAAQSPKSSDVTMENNTLTDEEQQAVENALGLKKQIIQKENYLADSIYMNLDAYQVNRVSIIYYVMLDDLDSYKSDTLQYISNNYVNAYVSYLSNGGMANQLRKAVDKKLSEIDLTELVRVSRLEGAQFMLNVYAENEEKVQELADKADEFVKAYQTTVEDKIGRHKLVVLDRYTTVNYDGGMAAAQNEQTETLKNMRANLQTLTAAFTPEQLELYNGVMEELEVEPAADTSAAAPSLRMKYLALGFLAGGFLVCMWIAGTFILSSRIYRVEELQSIYGLRIFGLMQAGDKKKRFLGFIDSWLDNIRQKEKWTLEEQQKVIVSNLLMTCKKDAIQSVMFTSAHHLDAKDKQVVDTMMQEMKQHDIQVVYGENMIRNVTTFEDMAETGQVVFIEKENVSTYQILEKELLLCIENKANVMGIVGLQ